MIRDHEQARVHLFRFDYFIMTRALLELCRISNLPTVWTNVIAAWVIASGGVNWRPELLWLLIGASLVYSAGMILNDTFDAAWDREKRPERPIPSGRIGLGTAWAIGIVGLVAGYAVMVFLGGAGWGITGLLLAAIVLYDAYHKPWSGSVVIMGLCRTLLYLTAAQPGIRAGFLVACEKAGHLFIDPDVFTPCRWVLEAGFVLGIYVVALTLVARTEAKKTSSHKQRRWLKVLLMVPLGWAVARNFLPAFGEFGTPASPGLTTHPFTIAVVSLVSAAVFAFWTIQALTEMRKGGASIGDAVGLLLAGIPLVDAILITPHAPLLAVAFCFLPPLLRYWQRWVAAT